MTISRRLLIPTLGRPASQSKGVMVYRARAKALMEEHRIRASGKEYPSFFTSERARSVQQILLFPICLELSKKPRLCR